MTLEHPTPPLPISAMLRPQMRMEGDLPATQAHQVMLHCALDGACIPARMTDLRAVTRIAELDYQTVAAVIRWLRILGDGR
ncbi:hypothetical protein OG698_09100 [Streptomyces sp. NBC_01003]|uniref:hypothetical protein n=1 Tax=Streptomyces sp. NBC_01003 TaxID=2903714 RepID=UPI003862D44A|nr:hypothetical protein OG698_09100 [Streptomyces sp. NBC_01003]